jgi:hypothetical protein
MKEFNEDMIRFILASMRDSGNAESFRADQIEGYLNPLIANFEKELSEKG